VTLRVLVADDSMTVRRRIAQALNEQPGFQVVGEAADGLRAVELCRELRPDVMTLDMAMPVMNGLDATQRLMAECPTPILIVSASTNRGDLFRTYDALAAGAVDVLDKSAASSDPGWDERLASALRVVARVKVVTRWRPDARPTGPAPAWQRPAARRGLQAVCIGASTGGPGAVMAILKGLPRDFPLPILLVLHLADGFDQALAQWLDSGSPLRAAVAQDGERLPPPGQGRVLLAPPGHHLILQDQRLRLDGGAERHSCRPSVDVLFESVAQSLGPASAACVLTGMGRDGAAGLLALRRAGALTIAQDEATSVVYGMPGEAVRMEAADQVLPLPRIAPVLAAVARGSRP
jgi:two-component system chemotaxis response regulator CheB